LSALSIVFALISRKNIGYYDGLSLAGLIVGIFGIVFGVASIILGELLKNSEYFKEFFNELEELLMQNGLEDPGMNPPETPANPGGPTA
jgi:hypothetical protein